MITFKPLAESDLALLHEWFQQPHIKLWYARDVTFTKEMINKKYLPRIHDPKSIPNFIILSNNQPIGYIQLYHLSDHLPDGIENYHHPLFSLYNAKDLAGIDLFIADENYLGKGYATRALQQFIATEVTDKFTALVVDPLKTNKRAIHFFARNGFKKFSDDASSLDNEILIYKTSSRGLSAGSSAVELDPAIKSRDDG